MLRDVCESNGKLRLVDECDFKEMSVVSALKRRNAVAKTVKPTMVKLEIIQNEGTITQRAPV